MTERPVQTECLNCSATLTGKFCAVCGQKLIEPNERSLKHFVYQFLGSAFFLENNFFKNVWVLITKPGLHTLDYIEGRRKRWMTPFSIFLLINLLYFVVNPLTDFNLSLDNQARMQLYSFVAYPMVEKRLANRDITFEAYARSYEAQSASLTKTLIILNAPISAFFFMLWFFRRRMYFADHFIFFVHFYAFALLAAVSLNGIRVLLNWVEVPATRHMAGIGLLVSIIYYFVASIKRVYKQRIFWLIISSIFALPVIVGTHLLYRFILFLITFWTT